MDSTVKILLVEDNPGDQIIIKKLLTRNQSPQFEVTTCDRLEIAKVSIVKNNFDTVLLDLTLPDSDGIETFLDLHATAPSMPIIVLTGLDVQEIAAQAVRNGAQDYIVKGESLQGILIRSILYGIERKKRISQEVELAKTQAHMHAMQIFMQDVTHDLKTPLSIIMTSGDLLSRYVPLDNPKVVRHLKNIIDQSDRLRNMINSIIEISNLTLISELDTETIRSIDLNILIMKLTESMGDVAKSHQVKLDCVVEDHQPIKIDGHETMIVRLLSNLIHNALIHTLPNGRVRVKLEKQESNAIIRVIDSGVGIPQDSIPHIFDRFYRVDASRSSQTGNSGLGLAIVKRIVELHHGDIQVESVVNKGTQFTVTLPLDSDEILI